MKFYVKTHELRLEGKEYDKFRIRFSTGWDKLYNLDSTIIEAWNILWAGCNYDAIEIEEHAGLPSAMNAFYKKQKEKKMKVDLKHKKIHMIGHTLEAENLETGEIVTLAYDEFKDEDNGFYVADNTNDRYNNEKLCEELLYVWEDEVEPLQPQTEWAKMVDLFNRAQGTSYDASEVSIEEMAEFTEKNNYFKFKY